MSRGLCPGFDELDCSGDPGAAVAATNSCSAVVGVSAVMDFGGDGTCPVSSAPDPTGAITPTGAFTFCCQR